MFAKDNFLSRSWTTIDPCSVCALLINYLQLLLLLGGKRTRKIQKKAKNILINVKVHEMLLVQPMMRTVSSVSVLGAKKLSNVRENIPRIFRRKFVLKQYFKFDRV